MIGMRRFAAIILVLLVTGCKVGPNYKRPVLATPDQYRGVAPDLSNQPGTQPFAEMQWETVFQDETLRALIREALANNYDMQIAASRILHELGVTPARLRDALAARLGPDADEIVSRLTRRRGRLRRRR